jgi:hypothetical protein
MSGKNYAPLRPGIISESIAATVVAFAGEKLRLASVVG